MIWDVWMIRLVKLVRGVKVVGLVREVKVVWLVVVDSVSSVSALACHIGRPNSVNTGQIVLVYGTCSTVFTYPYLATFKGQGTTENLTLWQIQRSPCDQGVKLYLKNYGSL